MSALNYIQIEDDDNASVYSMQSLALDPPEPTKMPAIDEEKQLTTTAPARYAAIQSTETPSTKAGFLNHPAIQSRLGLIYMVLSTVMFCMSGMSVKALYKSAQPMPTLELVFIRGLFGGFGGMWLLKVNSIGQYYGPPGTQHLLLFRGVFGFVYLILILGLLFWDITPSWSSR